LDSQKQFVGNQFVNKGEKLMKDVEIKLFGQTYKQWVRDTCSVILKPNPNPYFPWGIYLPIRAIDVGFQAGSPSHCFWIWSAKQGWVRLWEGNNDSDTVAVDTLLLHGVGDLYKPGNRGSGILKAPTNDKLGRQDTKIEWEILRLSP
jgi:hypothetical protein